MTDLPTGTRRPSTTTGRQSPEGIALLYALLPAAAAVASLLASTSRGGILAFGFALVLLSLSLWIFWGRRGVDREPIAGPPIWRRERDD